MMMRRTLFNWDSSRRSEIFNALLGTGLCVVLALGLSFSFRHSSVKSTLPIVFLVVIVAVTMRFGTFAGRLGTICCTLIFATLLFNPLNSLAVQSTDERSSLMWMLIVGLIVSELLPPPRFTK
jgi:K+-sensing histidine kinase KdpD